MPRNITRPTPIERCRFLPASAVDEQRTDGVIVDVSSYADEPWCRLSPYFPHGGIPVPGMPGTFSDSVEGVWQGLKVIRGRISERHFRGAGSKRGGGKPQGHRFGSRLLKLVDARYRIYRVAYEWMLDNCAPAEAIQQLVDRARSGVAQYLHDTCDNGDINDPGSPLAHAALLAHYVNRLAQSPQTRDD